MKPFKCILGLLGAAVIAAAASCSTSSPTEPSPSTPQTPKPPVPATTFSVTVTASPSQLTVGNSSSSTINVTVRQNDTGQPPADGTAVTLTTTLGGFGSAAGPQTLNLQTVNGRVSAVLFPGASAGTATVTATVAGFSGSAAVTINQASTFFVSGVNPNVGNPSGGDQVTITGGGFQAPVTVTFGSATAQVLSVSPGAVKVVTPSAAAAGITVQPGQSQAVTVALTSNSGAQQASLNNGFTYAFGGSILQPQVFSVTPTSGANEGGTTVTINGQGFQSPVQVLFGTGTNAADFNGVEASIVSVTQTKIVVVSPAARGLGQNNVNNLADILIKNLSNGFFTVSTKAFKYGSSVLVTSVAPNQVVYNRPARVTIFGQGFEQPVAVGLAGVAAQVLSTSGTEVQVMSPVPQITSCANLVGIVTVVDINNGNGNSAGPSFTFLVNHPAISSVSPTSGPASGGTVVTITGINFDTPPFPRAVFGNSLGSVTNVGLDGNGTGNSITVTTPPFTGTFPTQPCVLGTQAGTMSIPATVDVQVINLTSTCTDTARQAFSFLPPDSSCHVAPPPPVTPPKASFTFSRSALRVLFTDTSSGTPTSWSWTFGDPGSGGANTSILQNPEHDFSAPGTYVVTLSASNSGGSSTQSQFVTVP